jgi:fibronectin type 3 domain-containing protein/Ni,Fe-hydrogenase III component G
MKGVVIMSKFKGNWFILSFIFTLAFFSLFFSQSALASGEVSMTPNVEYTGNLQDYYDVDSYRINISTPSSVQIRFKHAVPADDSSWYIALYDSEMNETITSFYSETPNTNLLSSKVRVPAGTYYIKVNTYNWNSIDYNITAIVVNESASNFEREVNDTVGLAQTITGNKEYTGNLQDYYDDDYYKINITTPSSVQIRFRHVVPADDSSWYIALYDSEMDETITDFYSETTNTNLLSSKVRVPAGTYYIKVNTYNWSNIDYNITAVVVNESASNFEREVNDTVGMAQAIAGNKEYTGNLQDYYDDDYYRLTVNMATRIQIRFRHAVPANSSSWHITLYNSDMDEITYFYSETSNTNLLSSIARVPPGTYYIKIDSYNWSNIDYYMTVNVTDTTVKAASASYNSIKVSWTPVTGARYLIYRGDTSTGSYTNINSTASTSYTDAGLATGKTYYYKILAYRVNGSAKVYGTLSAYAYAAAVPAAPTLVKAAPVSYTSVNISWGAVDGATVYQVYRSTASNGAYVLVTNTSKRSYTDPGLITGKKYYYKVRACHLEGTTKVYGGYSSIMPATPVPASPAGVKAARVSANSIKVSWLAVAGATQYEIRRSTSLNGTYSVLATTGYTYYTNTGLTTGRTYYYKVRAYHLEGSTKVYSGFSTVAYAKP